MVEETWVRPYWYVDVKWIFGLLFFFLLSISLLFYTLSVLTSPKNAISIGSYITASLYSREGLDNPTDVEKMKAGFLKTKQEVYYPLPGQKVSVTRQELESLSPKELRLKIFQQVVEPIYYQPRTKESLSQYGVLAFFNHETYKLLQRIFMFTLIPILLTGIGMIVFSYGLGRLISLGLVLILVSILPTALLFFIQNVPLPEGDSGPLSVLPRELVIEVASSISPIYKGIFFVGLGLIVIAILVRILSKHRSDNHQ